MENKRSTKQVKTATIEVGVFGKITYQYLETLDKVTLSPQWGHYKPSKTSKFSKLKKSKDLIKLSEGIKFNRFKGYRSSCTSYSYTTYFNI